ncbi:MAG: hypothetical protein MUF41_05840 [Sphingopyxis sp.]|nr:hypothetical protein [Sphingopyxis sp.]
METRPRDVALKIEGLPGAVVWDEQGSRSVAGSTVNLTVAPDSVQRINLFVVAPPGGPQSTSFTIAAHALTGDERGDSDTTSFDRPEPLP